MFLGDYHTHTTYSHGKGSVTDSASVAADIGLKELAITDHGFNHMTFGVKRKKIPSFLADIKSATKAFPQLNILFGLEANIIDNKGGMDIRQDDLAFTDLIICGYHKLVRTGFGSVFSFSIPLFMSGLINKSSKKRRITNTGAFIKAIEKYPVGIISHPGLGIDIDFVKLAEACAHYGVLLELNGKRVIIPQGMMEKILLTGVKFIVNSDAHSPQRVGDFSVPLAYIDSLNKQYGESWFPMDRIANYNGLPDFKKQK